MYLVQLQQGERTHTVGLFRQKSDAQAWIESTPYVHKETEVFDQQQFVTYKMQYEQLPLYEEIVWKNSKFPITKYMFTPDDGEIEVFIWEQLPIMSEVQGKVEGMTQVDAYMIPNQEVGTYIEAREDMRKELIIYYGKLGKQISVGGIGSQDGEYLRVENGPFIHLDAMNVQLWQEKTSFEQFIEQLEE